MSHGPSTPQPSEEANVSLRALSEAFAEVIGAPAHPPAVPSPPSGRPAENSADEDESDAAAPPVREAVAPGGETAFCPLSPQAILEAMLFVGDRDGRPLAPARAAELMRGVTTEEIPALVTELNRRYAARGRPYEVVGVGSGYRLRLRPAFREVAERYRGRIREARLSQAAVDVLALVAYRQPITAEEIQRQRGRPSYPILVQLVRRRLLRIERGPERGDPARYYTTRRFLDLFGLESLGDLPRAEDFDADD